MSDGGECSQDYGVVVELGRKGKDTDLNETPSIIDTEKHKWTTISVTTEFEGQRISRDFQVLSDINGLPVLSAHPLKLIDHPNVDDDPTAGLISKESEQHGRSVILLSADDIGNPSVRYKCGYCLMLGESIAVQTEVDSLLEALRIEINSRLNKIEG